MKYHSLFLIKLSHWNDNKSLKDINLMNKNEVKLAKDTLERFNVSGDLELQNRLLRADLFFFNTSKIFFSKVDTISNNAMPFISQKSSRNNLERNS